MYTKKNVQENIHFYGSLGIAPTRNYTHFLKIGFVVAGGGFYSYFIHQRNKSDKKRKIVRKKLSLCIQKDTQIFKICVQFRVGAIPHLPFLWMRAIQHKLIFYLKGNRMRKTSTKDVHKRGLNLQKLWKALQKIFFDHLDMCSLWNWYSERFWDFHCQLLWAYFI